MLPGGDFAARLLAWYERHGRKDLPWQQPGPGNAGRPDAYSVWVSEVMLQQTQVQTVIPYFERFMSKFPRVHALATAPEDEVLHLWSGLGYYARARNLHATAQRVVADHDGEFPTDVDELVSLPGIGRSTAGAILSLAHGLRAPILDGNVKRVLCRHQAVEGYSGTTTTLKALWAAAEARTPHQQVGAYTQAIWARAGANPGSVSMALSKSSKICSLVPLSSFAHRRMARE
jgi:A/G-specific adenine glycosylase